MFSGRCLQAPRPFRPRSEGCAKRVPQTALSIAANMGTSLPAASRVAKRCIDQRAAVKMINRQVVFASTPTRIAQAENFAIGDARLYLGQRHRSWSATNSSPASPRCTAGLPTTEAIRPGSDRLSHERARGRRGGRTIGLRHGRPCAVHGQDARTGREAWPPAPMAFGRLP